MASIEEPDGPKLMVEAMENRWMSRKYRELYRCRREWWWSCRRLLVMKPEKTTANTKDPVLSGGVCFDTIGVLTFSARDVSPVPEWRTVFSRPV
jgi:hypothetical protein